MGDIVLTASVRQNLLSLQSTAELLSTTQTRLATGKKVNSALDNPTNYFTAAGLDSRASDINNLLDSIGNGVQVLQQANNGITSLQKLVDTAKSIANQALQTPSGYTTKSQATTAAIAGATADNLLGTAGAATANSVTGTAVNNDDTGGADPITGATKLSGTAGAGSDNLASGFTTSDTIVVNGTTISFVASGATGNQVNVTDDVDALLAKIDSITGGTSSVSGGQITLGTGTTRDLEISGSGLAKLGLTAGTTALTPGTTALSGKVLEIASTGGGTAVSVTFGTGAGEVHTLDQLNAALKDNNMTASISADGKITFTTTNDYASQTLGAFSGTATTDPNTFGALAGSAPAEDANSQNSRASLIAQYNKVIEQIRTTAQDASFNGVNLLNGDLLKLVFNETGKSTLEIQGVTFDPAGLGLEDLTKGTDFLDNSNTNAIIDKLNAASTTLRAQASAFGSNLSVVQIRQDFNKNLINVLQTGSANLTLADTNEEAANSQALATRQSIAVSALALANQSQQSVLQLLR
ncbi:MAG: flagellar protein [Proteobacteria bacterium]|nr:MAG: flagellar protein [Pseudomonadota bacterium]